MKNMLWVLALVLLALGCDNNSGPSTPPHDFGANNPGLYAAVGDSITDGLGTTPYTTFLAPLVGGVVLNYGEPGATTAQGIGATRHALGNKPGFLLILYGANDVIQDRDQIQGKENLRAMILMAKGNMTVPVIATLTPMLGGHGGFHSSANRFSVLIRELATEEGVTLVDLEAAFNDDATLLQSDGLHLTAAGAEFMAQQFAAAL